ncbi:hypothetical protein DMN91_002823 [Ooceraea biroi]|uniref:Uncharacterized protein n=1 Tax=Ooceraea biroi TaxID=2015173 RepID=A0A3L8DWW9_OOCBI|nr:hypothetical protein DMN91_002823 [Ooceraea biroi]
MVAGTKQSTPLTSVFPRAMPDLCQRARDCCSVLDSRESERASAYVRAFPSVLSRAKRRARKRTANTKRILHAILDLSVDRQIGRTFKAPTAKVPVIPSENFAPILRDDVDNRSILDNGLEGGVQAYPILRRQIRERGLAEIMDPEDPEG